MFHVQIINFSKQPEISSVFSEISEGENAIVASSRCAGNGSFPLREDSRSAETLVKEKPWL